MASFNTILCKLLYPKNTLEEVKDIYITKPTPVVELFAKYSGDPLGVEGIRGNSRERSSSEFISYRFASRYLRKIQKSNIYLMYSYGKKMYSRSYLY
jgi:hypothetical protein